jgi:hypothetical protein
MGLPGILLAVGMLMTLAYRGWSVLLLAPAAAFVVAAFAREPVFAHWTQTFMSSTTGFIGQFFPLFLLGTTLFPAPGLGLIASAIMLGFGLGWLRFVEARARRAGEGCGVGAVRSPEAVAAVSGIRERATTARAFDPVEIGRGGKSASSFSPAAGACRPCATPSMRAQTPPSFPR